MFSTNSEVANILWAVKNKRAEGVQKRKRAGDWNVQTGDNIVACVTKSGSDTRGVILFHDNARPHTTNTIIALLQKFKWEVLGHPPYSPDLSPCNYVIFGPLKKVLWGK